MDRKRFFPGVVTVLKQRLRTSIFSSDFDFFRQYDTPFYFIYAFSTVIRRMYGSGKTVFIFRTADLLLLFLIKFLSVE